MEAGTAATTRVTTPRAPALSVARRRPGEAAIKALLFAAALL